MSPANSAIERNRSAAAAAVGAAGPEQPLFDYLRSLIASGFWGAVTIKIEAGKLVHVREERNLKPEELSRQSRSNHDNRSG